MLLSSPPPGVLTPFPGFLDGRLSERRSSSAAKAAAYLRQTTERE